MGPPELLVCVLAGYLGCGLLFAPAWAFVGVQRTDPAARGASLGFRLAILPGAAALWPLLALHWARGDREPPEPRDAHRDAARAAGRRSAR